MQILRMKLVLIAALLVPAAARPLSLRAKGVSLRRGLSSDGPGGAHFGNPNCPCIGFDNIQGTTIVNLNGEDVDYPADLGAHCEAWDDGARDDCMDGKEQKPGKGEGWCAQQWCYVDACNCDLPVLPKVSVYVPKTTYQGKPIYFSYATCGGSDSYTKVAAENGAPKCRCIGIKGVPGTTEVQIGDGKTLDYPAETGGECKAWDDGRHPDCGEGGEKPDWCEQKWCYVDPCSCKLEVSPKTSSYLPDSTFQGKKVYYSYATCGGTDTWTAKHHKAACVNQESEDDCGKLDKCAWTTNDGGLCLGKELMDDCGLN